MAYVYADMDALTQYQQNILQTLSTLEAQVHCKEELIATTRAKICEAIERAREAERAAYTALRNAEDMLSEAEQRTRSHNANLGEDEEPVSTPDFYYENVSDCEQEHSYAEATLRHAQNTLDNFDAYVRRYRQQQEEGIQHFYKLLTMSGQFFESYIQKLVEVKLCTAVSDGSSGSGGGSSNTAGGDCSSAFTPAEQIKNAGQQWTDSLSKEQYAAFSAYTGTAYININETLRGLSPAFQAGNKERALLIHQSLSACSLPAACTVYRGASNAALGSLQNLPDHQLVGSFFSDNGFMSTSLNSADAFGGDIQLVISVPAGAKGAYVGYLSQLGHSESEVLFDMGSVMKITKVDRDNNGRRIIYAQMT